VRAVGYNPRHGSQGPPQAARPHPLGGAEAPGPAPGGAGGGGVALGCRGEALPGPLGGPGGGEPGPRPPPPEPGHRRAGRHAGLRRPGPLPRQTGPPGQGPLRPGPLAGRGPGLLHPIRRRGQRGRHQVCPPLDGPLQGPRRLPLLSRGHPRRRRPHRGKPQVARRARHPWGGPLLRPLPLPEPLLHRRPQGGSGRGPWSTWKGSSSTKTPNGWPPSSWSRWWAPTG
jgi:hypothetical protein